MDQSSSTMMTGFYHELLLLVLLLLMSTCCVVSGEPNISSESSLRPQFIYHSEDWLATFLRDVTEAFPHLTRIYSIGKSVQGLPAMCNSPVTCVCVCLISCAMPRRLTALTLLVGQQSDRVTLS